MRGPDTSLCPLLLTVAWRSYFAADLTEPDAAATLVAAALPLLGGAISCVVNNAGGAVLGHGVTATPAAEWDATFALNVRGSMLLTAAAAPHMGPGGVFVFISSIAAARPLANLSAYCAAKAAVEMLSSCVALELAPRGIRAVGRHVPTTSVYTQLV